MLNTLAQYYKALGEPTRLEILQYLLEKEQCMCICELIKSIKKDQSVISRHIKILSNAGLVKTNKDGKFLICCLKNRKIIKQLLEVNKNENTKKYDG